MLEPITNSASHRRALRRIEELWDASPGSSAHRELDALATLVDAYERRTVPIAPLTPAGAIRARCDQMGWTRKDLESVIGSRARVSEILSGRRTLTLEMIRRIHASMHIPAEILIAPAPRKRRLPGRNRIRRAA